MTENNRKPVMYLDQNVLDKLIKKGKDAHLLALKDKYHIVYSNGTLREIYKSATGAGDLRYAIEFITTLTILEATYFELPDIRSGNDAKPFESTESPCDMFLKFVNDVTPFDEFTHAFEKIGLTIYDGIEDYESFGNEQIKAMNNLRNFLINNLRELESELNICVDKNLKLQFETAINNCRNAIKELDNQIDEFKENVRVSLENFKEANKDGKLSERFRDEYNINKDKLEAIKGFDALARIITYIDEAKPDHLPSISDIVKVAYDDSIRIYQKIFILYDFLNLVGYYPDKKLNKEKEHLSSCLDRHHASLGCFCDVFVTQDKKFTKKMKVIYEHFNIATKIYDIEILDNGTTFIPQYDLELNIL